MASNGILNTNGYGGRYLQFSWNVGSQSIASNTTTVPWTLKGAGVGNAGWYMSGNFKLVIDGKTVYSSADRIKLSNGTVVATGTYVFSHNAEGAKSFSVQIEAGIYTYAVNCTANGTFSLPVIPRKSTLTVSDGTLGTAQSLKVTQKSTNFTHTITYKCGEETGIIVTKSSNTTISWTPTLSLSSQNTTGTSVPVVLTITTYSGGTDVGSNTYSITCAIPNSVKPTVSISVSDPTGNLGRYGAYVQGQSKIKVAISANGSLGSTVESYSTTADGKTYTEGTITTGVIVNTGSLTITTTVKDSRGRSETASKTISVLAYAVPQISSIAAIRCDQNGVPSSSGAYLAIQFSASVTSLNGNNTARYVIQHKKSTALSYTAATISDYKNNHTVSSGVFVFPADTGASYDIILTVSDAFKSVNKTTTGSSIKKVWSLLKKAGEIVGIAFGKIAELEGVFDVDMVIRARKGIIIDGEWLPLDINNNFEIHKDIASNQPRYKVSGNVVTIVGALSPKADFASTLDPVVIASGLPAQYRPSVEHQFVCQGSEMNRWNCSVTTSGTITMARYGITDPTTVPSTAWLVFSLTYQI